jgi:hypothetical protein
LQDDSVTDDIRPRLAQALLTGHAADEACRAEVLDGAWIRLYEEPRAATHLAQIWRRRVDSLQARDIRFVGEDIADRLEAARVAEVRPAIVHGKDNWTVFLDPQEDIVIGAIGVDGTIANESFDWGPSQA